VAWFLLLKMGSYKSKRCRKKWFNTDFWISYSGTNDLLELLSLHFGPPWSAEAVCKGFKVIAPTLLVFYKPVSISAKRSLVQFC